METELMAPVIAAPPVFEPDREVAFVITDLTLGEPFEVYKSANAWWMDMGKVGKLFTAFKNDMNIEEACITVGISRDQYYYFLKIHPGFSSIKEHLGNTFSAAAKLTLGTGLQKDPHLALRYLQGVQPEKYRRSVLPDIPPSSKPGGYARRTEELFTDEKGNVLVSRKTAMMLESYGTDTDTPAASE